ncbi:hypothetical protein OIU84_017025 [Salix udensis]|uniref:PPM-type phosphatase domain-containing protein n=1 Tax=Salix udensis TaxID=889485 RepID=A0AAD6L376_9ROSI|nr:hypothetical protein OIU84_017025 [Salix udensis]
MSRQSVASEAGASHFTTSSFHKFMCGACLNSSSSPDSSGKGKSKSSIKKLSHGFHLVEGKCGHSMEDYHVSEYRKKKNHELGLFAIFDGHLGNRVPSYLKDHLFNNILDEPNFWKDPATAIKNAYRSTNHFILENSMELGPGGLAIQLTVDHEPHTERKRIEKQGGFVITLPGDVPRVNGQLAVARAFGDQSLRAQLSSEPDVRYEPVDSAMDFVILASDGLWKVMKNQEAVDLVKPIKDPRAAAKRLTAEALARKSKDDISCIVIRFG